MTAPQLFLTREAERLGSGRELRQRYENGSLVRLRAGVYVERFSWDALDADAQYRLRVAATAAASRSPVQFSHDSAAVMWRLPSIGPWSADVHQLVERSPGGSLRRGVRRHRLGLDSGPAVLDGITVTSLSRTVLDICCCSTFVRAVAMVDAALRTPARDEYRYKLGGPVPTIGTLLELLERLQPYPAPARARRAIEFGNPLSGSPGESFCRVQFHALGLPAPMLQVELFDADGSIGFVDFYWPHLGLAIEFDGFLKYGTDRRYQRDLTPEQILVAEKIREDRIRRVVTSFDRLSWSDLADRRALSVRLTTNGLRPA